ncbi:hypothetical protein ACFYOH_34340, partial [Streptomyces sp. NPDC007856]
ASPLAARVALLLAPDSALRTAPRLRPVRLRAADAALALASVRMPASRRPVGHPAQHPQPGPASPLAARVALLLAPDSALRTAPRLRPVRLRAAGVALALAGVRRQVGGELLLLVAGVVVMSAVEARSCAAARTAFTGWRNPCDQDPLRSW